ncbi:TAXI family TRAP transporter solute-binding subunit [Azospirillum sp. sgz302134]
MALSRRGLLGGLLGGVAAAGVTGVTPHHAGAAPAPAPVPVAEHRPSFRLATDGIASPFYAVGVSLSALVKMRVPAELDLDLYPMASLGSWQNAVLLRKGRAEFAMMEALFGHWARQGAGLFRDAGPDPSLRAVAGLWPNVEHVLIQSRRVATGTVADLGNLDGAPFSVGPRGSSTEATSHLILARAGADIRRAVTVVNNADIEGASALMMGDVAGMALGGGLPVSTVDAVLSRDPSAVRILDFTDRQRLAIDRGLGMFVRHVIPPGTYTGQEQPVSTIGQRTFLAVRADVDEAAVYTITRAIMENLPILANGHRAAASLSAAGAVDGLPVPLHPGAARYFAEIGLTTAAK